MRFWLIHIFLCLAGSLFGQKLSARISDSTILIGEPIVISYTVETNSADSIWFEANTSSLIGRLMSKGGKISNTQVELEIQGDFDTTLQLLKKTQRWTGSYTITCWDSGHVLIPGPRIVIDDSTFIFADLRFNCDLIKATKGQDLYDIRENYAEVPQEVFSFKEYVLKHWYWIVPILLLSIGLIVFLWIRRKRRAKLGEHVHAPKPISLKDRTIRAIEKLEEQKLWEKEQLKEHYVELSYILRSYLTERYGVALLEKTTHEASLILHRKGLEKETIATIVQILSQADMVKFAKSKPETLAILRVSAQAKQIVAETSPLEFDHAE